MSDNRSICHLVLSLHIGGTERIVEHLIRNAPDRSFCICLNEFGEIGESLQADCNNVALIKRKKGTDLTVAFKIAGFLRKNRIQILHCHHYSPWFYGVQAALFSSGTKVIFTEHGRFYPDGSSSKKRIYNRIMQHLTHSITAVSPAVKNALAEVEAFNPEYIEVVYNGINPAPFTALRSKEELRRKLGLTSEATYIIWVGRFDTIKWIPGLIKAFGKSIAQNPGLRLILIGDGSEKPAIVSLISELNLGSHVIMPGFKSNVPEWLGASDIFVLCSLSEGTSISLIESMACGLPAIATKVGGNEFVLEDKVTGMLVPAQNVETLRNALVYLSQHLGECERMGKNAYARFRELYTLERMTGKYQELYRKLLE